ncbi:MAG: RnfABCDGE type electron transport complex subunit D [Planctomycetes bacterium]|nr:RnfABCDGE type electron transport complex subunit D [Planctomycetota bacterium]
MFNVVLALLPVTAFAVYAFGLTALLTLITATGACVLAEHLVCRLNGKPTTIGDWSAVITGLLYGLSLPPGLPLWMTAVGGVIAIVLGKALFGGLGSNPFNPALVGRAILQAAFPVAMTTWPVAVADRFTSLPSSLLAWPFMAPTYDGLSGATPLALWKFDHQLTATADLFFGLGSGASGELVFTAGSTGETSALLVLLGGAWLVARRMMNWRIPLAIFATVFVFCGILETIDPARYAGPMFMLLSGGMMLGAVFMATDMVGSPMTHMGCVVHGIVIGVLVVVIRVWGGMPEGMMYAILLANALAPHIDGLIRPRVYGTRSRLARQTRRTS